jgi:hypothetical protein
MSAFGGKADIGLSREAMDGFARISSGRWMPVRGGALSAKGLALDGLQLPLQGLPAFLRSGIPGRRCNETSSLKKLNVTQRITVL